MNSTGESINMVPLEQLKYEWDDYFETSTTLTFWAVFGPLTLMGVSGNLLVMLAVLTCNKMRKSAMNILMANLALADVGNLLMSTPDWMIILINRAPAYTLWAPLCTICRYFGVVCLYASLLTQVAICAERYVATLHPLHVSQICSKSKIMLCILCLWLFSFLFSAPNLRHSVILRRVSPTSAMPMCTMDAPPNVYYKLAEFCLFYIIPLMLLLTLYAKIAKLLWSTPSFLLSQQPKMTKEQSYDSAMSLRVEKAKSPSVLRSISTYTFAVQKTKRSRQVDNVSIMHDYVKRLKVRRRVVIMLVVCVSIYFICYSPIQVLFLMGLAGIRGHEYLSFAGIIALNALCYANSACNPIVYTVFSEKFRARIFYILKVLFSMGRLTHKKQQCHETMSKSGTIANKTHVSRFRSGTNGTRNGHHSMIPTARQHHSKSIASATLNKTTWQNKQSTKKSLV